MNRWVGGELNAVTVALLLLNSETVLDNMRLGMDA